MFKKWNRVLAFLLSIALVFTTFGSDFATARVYAGEEETVNFNEVDGDNVGHITSEIDSAEIIPGERDGNNGPVDPPAADGAPAEGDEGEDGDNPPAAPAAEGDGAVLVPEGEAEIPAVDGDIPAEGEDTPEAAVLPEGEAGEKAAPADGEDGKKRGAAPEEKEIVLTINYEAGKGGSIKAGKDKEELAKDEEIKGSEAVADEGYTFVNWTDGETVVSEDESGVFVPTAEQIGERTEVTFTANFEQSDFTVTYMVDGSEYFTRGYSKGEALAFPEDPFKAGYFFRGWTYEGEKITSGTVNSDMTLVADLEEIKIFEVTVDYFYFNPLNPGEKIYFDHTTVEVEKNSLPVTVTSPSDTQVNEDEECPTYYPKYTSIEITQDDIDGFVPSADGSNIRVVDPVTVGILENKEVEFVPSEFEYLYVYMLKNLDDDDYTVIESIPVRGVKNTQVTPEVKAYPYAVFDHTDTYTVTEDGQELFVYYNRANFTLQFNSKGGEFFDAVNAPYETKINVEDKKPTYKGYKFGGWYANEDLTGDPVTSVTLTKDTTLFAKWNPDEVKYSVVYMAENADDTDYSYVGREEYMGLVGDEVKAADKSEIPSSINKTKLDSKNFTFNREKSTTAIVKADGTTVVTAYYNRKVYTIKWWNGEYYNKNDKIISSGNGTAELSAKYGADIKASFNDEFMAKFSDNYAWCVGKKNNYFKTVSVGTMPSPYDYDSAHVVLAEGIIKAYAYEFSTEKTQILNYYLEGLDSTEKKTVNGKTYGLYISKTGHFNYLYTDTDFYEIAGYSQAFYNTYKVTEPHEETYTYYEWEWDFWQGWHRVKKTGKRQVPGSQDPYDYEFDEFTPDFNKGALMVDMFYDAGSYPLTFIDYDGKQLSTQPVKLNADISSYFTVNQAASVNPTGDSTSTWDGWYTDSEHESKYNGTYRMPAGLVLYANWKIDDRTIYFMDPFGTTEGDGKELYKQTYEYGQTAASYEPTEDQQHEGYNFGGWYIDRNYSKTYNFNQKLTTNVKVYAKWNPKDVVITVKYLNVDTGSEVAPSKTLTGPAYEAGKTHTEKAVTVAGMLPDANEKSVTLKSGDNVIEFNYKTKQGVIPYTVRYIYKDEGKEIKVAPDYVDEATGNHISITVAAKGADKAFMASEYGDTYADYDFYPEEDVITHNFTFNSEDNVITFYYHTYSTGKVNVEYVDMDGDEIKEGVTKTLKIGAKYTIDTQVSGYVMHHIEDENKEHVGSSVVVGEGTIKRTVYFQKTLTIKAEDKSKDYDGKPLKSEFSDTDYSVTGLATEKNHRITGLSFDGEQTDAGSSATTPKNAVIEGAASDYYKIVYEPGTLTVNAIEGVEIYISASTYDDIYDGNSHTVKYTFDHATDSALTEDCIYSLGTVEITSKDVINKTDLAGQFFIKDEYVKNFTKPVWHIGTGYIKISPKMLTVTTGDANTIYGEVAKNENGTIEGFIEGEGGTLDKCVGERTHVIEYVDGQPTTYTENTVGGQIWIPDENTKKSNYDIDWKHSTMGHLTVDPRPITINITGHVSDPDIVYDSQPHTVEGYDMAVDQADQKVLDNLGISYDMTKFDAPKQSDYSVTETAVGLYPLGLKQADFENKNTDTDFKVTPVVTDGYLNIVKPGTVVVTITGTKQAKVYNAAEQTVDNDAYSIAVTQDESGKYSVDKVQKISQKDAKDNAAGTTVGKYAMHLDDKDTDGTYKYFKNADPNFEVQFVITDGELEIKQAEIEVVVTGATDTKTYNGGKQTVSGYTIDSVTLVNDGKSEDAKALYTQYSAPKPEDVVASGTDYSEAAYPMGLSEDDFDNLDKTSFNVKFVVTDGWLKIEKRNVSVSVEGKKLTNQKYTGVEQSVNGYDITFTEDYEDGLKLYKPEYMSLLAQDDAKATAKGTNVGTYNMTFTADNFAPDTSTDEKAAINNNFVVSVTAEPGLLEIVQNKDAITVEITGNNDTVDYNGKEQKVTGFTYKLKNAAGEEFTDDTVTVALKEGKEAIAKGTNADTYYMNLTKDFFTATSANYEKITIANPVDGYLVIRPKERTEDMPEVEGYEGVYDGKTHSITITGGITEGDAKDTYTYSYDNVIGSDEKPTAKDVKDSKSDIIVTVHNQNYRDVSLNSVNLIVNPRPVVVKTASDTKPYDGTPLTNPEAEMIAIPEMENSGLVEGEEATVAANGSQTEVGGDEHNNTYDVEDIDWKSADPENYTVLSGETEIGEEYLGTLTVTKCTASVILTAPGDSKDYDGTKFVVDPSKQVKATGNADILAKFSFPSKTAVSSKSDSYEALEFVNAGSAYNVITEYDVVDKETGESVKDNFDLESIQLIAGDLTINPAKVYVSTYTDSKPYDGEPLVAGGEITVGTKTEKITVEDDYDAATGNFSKEVTLIGEDKAVLRITGTITEVGGPVDNTYEFVGLSDNYKAVTKQLGNLTIAGSDAKIIITVTGGEYEYDGTTHYATATYSADKDYTVENLTVAESSFAKDATTEAVPANVGSFVIKNKNGKDVTEQLKEQGAVTIVDYDNVEEEGKKPVIVVNPKTLVVNTPDAEKPYDGKPLKAEGTIDGFVEGESAEFKTTGEETDVNENVEHAHNNTYEINWKGQSAKQSNYTIDETVGTLTITGYKQEIKLEALSGSKPYDGTPLEKKDITEESKNSLPNNNEGMFKVVPVVEGTVTHVSEGKVVNKLVSWQIMKGDQDVTSFFTNVTPVNGELYIEAIPLNVSVPSATKKYDGLPLTVEGSLKGFVGEETAEIKTLKSVTYVDEGEVTNDYQITWTAAQSTDYYEVPQVGTLQILGRSDAEKLPIKAIPVNEEDKVYNGKVYDDFNYVLEFGQIETTKPEIVEPTVVEERLLDRAVNNLMDAAEKVADFVSGLFSFTSDAKEVSGSYSDADGRSFKATANAKVVADREAKNVGTYALSMDTESLKNLTVVDGAGKDVSDQFKLVAGDPASLKITPAPVSVSVADATMELNGTEPEYVVTVDADEAVKAEAKTTVKQEVTHDTITKEGNYVLKIHGYDKTTTETEPQGNFLVTYVPGVLTVTAVAPTPTPRPRPRPTPTDDDEPTPSDNNTTIPDAQVPLAPAPSGAVLGAQREAGDGAAVLGARRGRTDDPANSAARIFAIVMAAMVAISMMLTGKKKEEDQ